MVFGWFRGRTAPSALDNWHRDWSRAAEAPSDADVAALRSALDALGLPAADIEVEQEMLDGLAAAAVFTRDLADGLPVVETGHRVVGSDVCHFIAAASRTDDAAQTAGRLLFTHRRAIFTGGPSAVSLPWHTVTAVSLDGRDLALMARAGGLRVFRCNSYADALRGRLIAARLADGTPARPPL